MNLNRYYSDFHSYFFSNRKKIYNILNGLKEESHEMIVDTPTSNSNMNVDHNNNFTDFYFFYIQKLDTLKKRSNFSFYNNNVTIPRNLDLLVGLNFSNYKPETEIQIFLETGKTRKKIARYILTKKNVDDVFLPVSNLDFFPYFLVGEQTKLVIYSNMKLDKEINLIYLKIHRDLVNKYLDYGSFLINIRENSFINIQDFNVEIKYFKKKNLRTTQFVFFHNTERYYALKIYKFLRRVLLRKFLIQYLDDEYDVYKDITNIILKHC
jgi:hypothetical protein